MKKFLSSLLLLVAFSYSAVVGPSQSTMAILLDASSLCKDASSASWKNLQLDAFLKKHAFYGDSNSIYCRSYDASMNPSEVSDFLFQGKNSIFSEAIKKWSQNGKILTSENAPNRFLVIAEGVAGLAVREYIQSKDYQGEIENVVFFNTPHEGTGFADQALLNGSSVLDKSKSASDYSDIIPLALAVYLVGGGDALENLMMSLLKEAVFGMAQNAGGIKREFSSFFENADQSYKSLLYLSQDLDLSDAAYDEVKRKAQEKGIELKNYAGSTQLLNSFSKLNAFDHPAYNAVYSYGLPSIGNGRRTLADFADQAKNHVDKERLGQMLTESVSATLAENGIAFAPEDVGNIVSNAMHGDLTSDAMSAARQIAAKYDIPVGQISECVREISSLGKLKFNKEELSKSVLKVIGIANKYLPEKYKSELFSTFLNEYSATLAELGESVKSIEGDLKKGMDLVSGNLSNYAINFFDEGTFDVPAFSAIGKNVRAFQESGVTRIGVSLKDYVRKNKPDYPELNDYIGYVSKAGELESIRQDIDLGLKIGCHLAEAVNPGVGKACRAAQFMANVALIANVSMSIEKAMSKVGALKNSKYVAVKQSMERKPAYNSWQDHNGNSHAIESSDMEKMLFGTPIVSLQTVRKGNGSADSIVPLVLYKTFEKVENFTDISKDSVFHPYLFPASEFAEIHRNALANSSSVMVKDVQEERKNGLLYKNSRYATADGFTVSNFIREYRFAIDDFQPDELRLIKLDFNARMQIAYERDGNTWYIYRGTDNRWEENPIDTLSKSPVQKDGLFVFRPKEVFNRGIADRKDSILLSAIQEDGANCVSVHVVNKVGNANSQQIHFKFQAVDYLIEEGWPKSFETVSRMDSASIYSNDLGYGASLGKYRLIVLGPKNKDTVDVFVDSLEGAGARYRFRADLSSVWNKHPLENSTYTLKWDLGFQVKTLKADYATGEQNISYNPQTIVFGDNSAPKLVFDTTLDPKAVSVKRDEALAHVINLDSAENRSLRGLRSFMVRRETMDTVWLLNRAHVGEPFYEIGWNGNFVPWSGLADLYVQAYDFADPDSSLKAELVHVVGDSAKSSWSLVMQSDTSFKPGINGISLHREILVDGEAPLPTGDSVTTRGFADSSLPPFSRNGTEIFLNSHDTLVVSFSIDENLFSRDSESVSVELVFKDSSDNGKIKWKRFLSDFTIDKFSKRFVFEEPQANRLEDGIYSLTVFLTDEAGNRSEKRILEKLRVDRTPLQIRGISLGDVAYENAAELKKGTAHLSQSGDDSRNRSDLACYVKVDINDKKGEWIGPVAETESRNTLNSNIEFDIKNASSDSSDGIRHVYFGCYDDVGNFGKNVNLVGIGARYPKITFPKSGSGFYGNRILVKGFAPDPDIRGSNTRGEFRVSWRKQEDSLWSDNGIRYLVFDRSLSPSERDLAVWNSAGLEKGEYVLRLSARSCDTCKWVSDEKTVPVDDFVQPDSANAPKLVIIPSVGKHFAGLSKEVSIELKNVPDTSKWVVSASIEAPSPKDSSVYVKAVEKTFDPMTVSPFKMPATASDSGLSIWQEADGVTWHVRYTGNASSVTGFDSANADTSTSRRNPYLAIRFVGDSIDWNLSPAADSSVALGFVMDSVKIKNEFMDIVMPPYDETKMWKLGTDCVHLVFKTTTPFTVDASLSGGVLYRDSLSVVYVYPEKYKAHIAWDGLVNGIYSSGSLVKMNVIAYEKGNERNIVCEEAEWFLEYGNTGIEISSDNLEKYYVNFLGSSADSSEAKMADYGFRFKLTGRSAYVTAEVLDSGRHVVRTLMDRELVLATSGNQWKTLQWNGVKNDGLLQPGPYSIHLLVKNDTGATIIDTLYPFEMNLGENIREAGKDSLGRIAELRMDEAFLDPDGNFRYVGKPDYLLRTNVSAITLPEERRTFRYEWDVYGTQHPAIYRKTRPSLGIRRHRDEFWATVVTLVMGESRKYQISYSGLKKVCYETGKQESRGYWYRIDVKKIQFKENARNQEISVDLHPENGTSGRVYGYLNNSHDDSPEILHNLAAIKILPASTYDHIKATLGDTAYFSNAVWDGGFSVSDDFPWDSVYEKDSYSKTQVSQMKNWFNSWGQALYYEAVNTDFRIITNSDSLNNAIHKDSSTRTLCESDNINANLSDSDANFVCGAKSAYEEIDSGVVRQFNPHAYMMKVNLEPFDNEKSFVIKKFDKNDCSEMDGSGSDIKVKFVLEMNPDYWNPPVWGTNNLANRYVRFDPVNKTLYGADGYVSKLQILSDHNFANFYNGSNWTFDASLDNGPTVFEAKRLWMHPVPENPLLFNDEIHAENSIDTTVIKYYPSEYSWRFYRGSGDVTYKAEARSAGGNLLASFRSDDRMP